MKKKIAVVVQRYGMEVNGGAELECRYYAERLTPFYDVTVFTTCAVDYTTWENVYEEGETELNGVRVIRYPVIEPRDQEVFTEVYVRLNEAMAEDINNVDIDLQHEWMAKQGPNSPALIAAIQANKDNYEAFVFMTYLYYSTYWGLKAVPEKAILISTAHDEPPVYIPMFEEIFQSPKAIFYNTRVERTFVEGKFENSEIRNEIGGAGVDLPENIDIKGFHERNQVPEEYIVYIGRIDVSKGCQELFDDLDAYNKDRVSVGKEKIPLVLIGKPAMEIPERDDIIQLGFVSENDKYAAIVESKFLVLPSHFESLSFVVLEAFRLEKPVLVSGHCEVLKDHCVRSNGGLYFTNEKEFKLCMEYLLSHEKEAIEMGKNGRYYQFNNYSWDIIIARLARLIEYVASSNAPVETEATENER